MLARLTRVCDRIIEYGFYLLFLLVPLIFTPWNFELFEFNKMFLTYFLTAIIAGAFATRCILDQRIKLLKTPLDIPILLFLMSLVISTIYSIDMHTSVWGYYSRFNGGLASILCYIALFYVFVNAMDLGKTYKTIIVSLVSGFLVILWGLPSHFGYDPSCLLFNGTLDTTCWTDQFRPEIRIFSTLGQPNWLAAYLSILIPIAIALGIANTKSQASNSKQSRSFKLQILNIFGHLNLFGIGYLVLGILFYLALLFTSSRSGFLGFAVGFLVLFAGLAVLEKRLKLSPRSVYSLLFIVCAFVITFFVGTPFEQLKSFTLEGIQSRFQPTTENRQLKTESGPALETGGTESGEIRKIVWKGAIDIARHYPLFGSGVETFAYSYYKFRPVEHNLTSEWDFLYNKAHNEYLNYLATTGFFGLGSYLLMIGMFLVVCIKYLVLSIKKKTHNTNYLLLTTSLLAAYVSILVSNFFGFSVVITNLYLFLIPAFVFVLNGMVLEKKAVVFPKVVKSSKQNTMTKIAPAQWILITGVSLITTYFLLTFARFWIADMFYSTGYNLDRSGQFSPAYEPLFNAVVLRDGEPNFKVELAFNNAALATFFGTEDATSSAQLVQNAIVLSDAVVAKSPNNVTFWKDRTRIFYSLSEFDPKYLQEAITSLEKARELAPTDPKITYNLAILYGQDDRIDDAVRTLEETIKLKPDYQDAYYALGLFYNEQGDVTKAIGQMQFILDNIASDDADAQDRITEWRGF